MPALISCHVPAAQLFTQSMCRGLGNAVIRFTLYNNKKLTRSQGEWINYTLEREGVGRGNSGQGVGGRYALITRDSIKRTQLL